MPIANDRLRLLLAAADPGPALAALGDPGRWEVVAAATLAHARFVQQMQPCDVVLAWLGETAGEEDLGWLPGGAPLVLVCPVSAAAAGAVRRGALWLDTSAAGGPMLAAVLEQAARRAAEQEQHAADRLALRDSRARADRLLGLLWEAAPGEGPARWLTQRAVLERLDEEVARSRRHGGPLSVVLAELHPPHGRRLTPEQAHRVGGWLADRLARGTRRCDVAGRYGPDGFLLVLPQTGRPEALRACGRLRGLLAGGPPAGLPAVEPRFGLASLPDDQPSLAGLLCRAEERLAQAPAAGPA
jgi:diguanylate cyclase (GGDEF)-like protein